MASPNTRRFNSTPSPRILELARPRESKTVWLTTPVKVTWGNQETIWPPFRTSLKARNMSRILALSQPKKDFSALHQDLLRKDHKEAAKIRSTCLPATSQYEQVSRLATPNFRHRCPQVLSLPHTKRCEHSISSAVKNAVASPRILQLAQPRHEHPEYQSNRQSIETCGSRAANSSQVSKAARKATASARVKELSIPKSYTPP
ncbi:testicular haploid expressed gene protein-like isoform X2 [Tachysurus fulvidraco]|uniref:testicular haploid expressed gene protein-like isoform X2 n=1 Tax=Tachysurus fulvidraco TaxID=1234273 RepID=UPI000F4D8FD3|nr:testicular haploid expressed gene protein-like isoform X2 [Tachysurus fulvidraco]